MFFTQCCVDDLFGDIARDDKNAVIIAARKAQAVVLESAMVPGLGPAANIMVQNGTLKVGDIALCGEFFGKVKALINDKGVKVKSAGPSTPVQVIGLSGSPNAGAK